MALLATARLASGAESFQAASAEFNAARTVTLRPDQFRPVVVTEFLHQGEITPDGRNVAVVAKNRELVPVRILQVGPGDFCRLAFQTIPRQTIYTIYYGGEAPAADKLPQWTDNDGLLLETRRFVDGNLRGFEAVRQAFESAEPIGADYVETIQHAANPFLLAPGPFMSRYHGTLHISEAGQYTFWTASQDCSFLAIDDKLVVEAPGRHGPDGRARPGSGRTIQLTAGPHAFDYYHAAAGNAAMMMAAWVAGPAGSRPRPTLIPREAFHASSIGRAAAGELTSRRARVLPDFGFTIAGDVPLPDNPQPLVGVAFRDESPQTLVYGTTARWDFGDGQNGDRPNMEHVYLRPGTYRVTLSRRRGGKTASVTNRICVDRPYRTWASREKVYTLDDYLPILQTYDPKTLDAASLRQLVAALLWKADLLRAALEDAQSTAADEPAGDKAAGPAKNRRAAAKAKQNRRESAKKGSSQNLEQPPPAVRNQARQPRIQNRFVRMLWPPRSRPYAAPADSLHHDYSLAGYAPESSWPRSNQTRN